MPAPRRKNPTTLVRGNLREPAFLRDLALEYLSALTDRGFKMKVLSLTFSTKITLSSSSNLQKKIGESSYNEIIFLLLENIEEKASFIDFVDKKTLVPVNVRSLKNFKVCYSQFLVLP
ncbi:MAG: hypothetical protein ACXAEU_05210 [Candidatus Hodarchaeales archaeon]